MMISFDEQNKKKHWKFALIRITMSFILLSCSDVVRNLSNISDLFSFRLQSVESWTVAYFVLLFLCASITVWFCNNVNNYDFYATFNLQFFFVFHRCYAHKTVIKTGFVQIFAIWSWEFEVFRLGRKPFKSSTSKVGADTQPGMYDSMIGKKF